MAKPPARRVLSDDFTVEVDGQTYAPHTGEWIEFVPTLPIAVLRAAESIRNLPPQIDALTDAEGNISGEQMLAFDALMFRHFDDLCRTLAPLILAWTWTDARGQSMPDPDGTDAPLQVLTRDELYYVWQAAQGQNPATRKNG